MRWLFGAMIESMGCSSTGRALWAFGAHRDAGSSPVAQLNFKSFFLPVLLDPIFKRTLIIEGSSVKMFREMSDGRWINPARLRSYMHQNFSRCKKFSDCHG